MCLCCYINKLCNQCVIFSTKLPSCVSHSSTFAFVKHWLMHKFRHQFFYFLFLFFFKPPSFFIGQCGAVWSGKSKKNDERVQADWSYCHQLAASRAVISEIYILVPFIFLIVLRMPVRVRLQIRFYFGLSIYWLNLVN